MFELHKKGKISESAEKSEGFLACQKCRGISQHDLEEYLQREYNPKEVKLLLKDLRKK